jgi:hypothetical protein
VTERGGSPRERRLPPAEGGCPLHRGTLPCARGTFPPWGADSPHSGGVFPLECAVSPLTHGGSPPADAWSALPRGTVAISGGDGREPGGEYSSRACERSPARGNDSPRGGRGSPCQGGGRELQGAAGHPQGVQREGHRQGWRRFPDSCKIGPMDASPCGYCGGPVPLRWERCPHCAQPGLFPNVRVAEVKEEQQALEQRYREALWAAAGRGAQDVVAEFETAVGASKAVMARPMRELDRLSASDQEIIPTYYGLLKGQVRLPHGNEWDGLRGVADEALFPGYKEHIRFAALSLDGKGLPGYGECFFVFQEGMIGHRASVYEENSAVSLKKHGYPSPPGHRATWPERSRLCVAKLAGALDASTRQDEFPSLLLQQGTTPEEDRFVEVHIWGPMTIRTIERILIPRPRSQAVRKSLRDRAKKFGVELEELP